MVLQGIPSTIQELCFYQSYTCIYLKSQVILRLTVKDSSPQPQSCHGQFPRGNVFSTPLVGSFGIYHCIFKEDTFIATS